MASILLSIKPKYVYRILSGEKRYEYRRALPTKPFDRVVVYCSAPVQSILCEFVLSNILAFPPEELWEKTKDFAGMAQTSFFDYFKGKQIAYAIEIGEIEKYQIPKDLFETYGLRPPQSFCYLP